MFFSFEKRANPLISGKFISNKIILVSKLSFNICNEVVPSFATNTL